MPLQIEAAETVNTAKLSGELGIGSVEELQDELLGLLNLGQVLLDLDGLESLDGCGAQLLVILWQEFQSSGRTLSLRLGDAQMRRSLSWLGLPDQAFAPDTEPQHGPA